jgi:hypothetical protein
MGGSAHLPQMQENYRVAERCAQGSLILFLRKAAQRLAAPLSSLNEYLLNCHNKQDNNAE